MLVSARFPIYLSLLTLNIAQWAFKLLIKNFKSSLSPSRFFKLRNRLTIVKPFKGALYLRPDCNRMSSILSFKFSADKCQETIHLTIITLFLFTFLVWRYYRLIGPEFCFYLSSYWSHALESTFQASCPASFFQEHHLGACFLKTDPWSPKASLERRLISS